MYLYVYKCIYIHIYDFLYIYMWVYIRIYMCIPKYICIFIYIVSCVCLSGCARMYTYIYIHIPIYLMKHIMVGLGRALTSRWANSLCWLQKRRSWWYSSASAQHFWFRFCRLLAVWRYNNHSETDWERCARLRLLLPDTVFRNEYL